MNDLGSSSPHLKHQDLHGTTPHSAAAAFVQGHTGTQRLTENGSVSKSSGKSIPTVDRRMILFWRQGRPVTSHPFLRVSSQPVLLSVVVSFPPLRNPQIIFIDLRDRKEGGERETSK